MDDQTENKNLHLQKYHEMIETEVTNPKGININGPGKLILKFLEHNWVTQLRAQNSNFWSERRTRTEF